MKKVGQVSLLALPEAVQRDVLEKLEWQELSLTEEVTDESELRWLREHLRPEPFRYVYSDMGEPADQAIYDFVDAALEGKAGRIYAMWHHHPNGDTVGNDYVVVKVGGITVVATRDTDNRVASIIRGGK